MGTVVQGVTAEQLLQMEDDGFRYDLIEGELDKMPPAGGRHGDVAAELGALLRVHTKQQRLGKTFAAETGFLMARNPDVVLGPDVSFVRAERVPAQGVPEGYFPGSPDLAVEVISPSQSRPKIEKKVAIFLAHGAQAVVVLDPKRRTATIRRPKSPVETLGEGDTLELGFVVTGFSVALADLFS
jgi:Uma2 family endonuclease